jgi:hypothetical protein
MNNRKNLGLLMVGSLALALAFLLSCGDDRPTEPSDDTTTPVVSLISNSSCKNFFDPYSPIDRAYECIDWSYGGDGVLMLNHINAGFNCCVTSLTTDLTVANKVIVIDEGENLDNGGCHCLCLYDLEMMVSPLSEKKYTFLIIGPYMDDESTTTLDYVLFTIDLSSETEGTYCVQRSQYPWD